MIYAKLRGRIKEIYGTQGAFADAIDLDASSLSAKLNGKTEWTRKQIEVACEKLGIDYHDVPAYFFN